MNTKERRKGNPKDTDIENPDEFPVSPDGMNRSKHIGKGVGSTEDSSGAGTSTNTCTKIERHFSNKVGPLAVISIPILPLLKDKTIQSKFGSFKNTMLEIFEGPFQDCDSKAKASYLRLWLSKEAGDTLIGIKNWEH